MVRLILTLGLVLASLLSDASELADLSNPTLAPVITLPPVISLPLQIPIAIPTGIGGVTVGGGEISQSICSIFNNETLRKNVIPLESLKMIRKTRLEIMINIATLSDFLTSQQKNKALTSEQQQVMNTLSRRLKELPDLQAEIILSHCSAKKLFKVKNLNLDSMKYLEQAFNYLEYYSDWE